MTARSAASIVGGALVALVVAASTTSACKSPAEQTFPVAAAPASRHDDLRDSLTTDSRAFSFDDGDWLEDLDDAPFYGLATLVHRAQPTDDDAARLAASLARARALLMADVASGNGLEEQVMAALGVVDHYAVTKDAADVVALDSFLDRLDTMVSALGDYLDGLDATNVTVQTYGATAVTALVGLLHAHYALFVEGPQGPHHLDRAIAIEQKITDVALSDLVDGPTSRSVRGYAIEPGTVELELYPNVAMLLLEARLYRLTTNSTYLLEARAIYGAIQPLKLEDVPARYASPYAATALMATTSDVATLSSQNYLALGLLLMFEITGETSFSEEADRVLDAIETMRGPWCLSQVDKGTCAPTCSTGQACVGTACTADRCTTGLLYDEVDGRLARPTDPVLFCSGCSMQTLYVIGYRRQLAGEPF